MVAASPNDRPQGEPTASHRLAQLQALTAALSAATTVAEVGRVVTSLARDALGARTASLWVVDGDALVAVAQTGDFDADLAPFQQIRLASDVPAARVVATGTPLWGEGPCLPLFVEHRVAGVVAWGFDREHVFGDDEKAFVLTVAGHSALAIDRARLFEETRAALDAAENANRAKDEFFATLSHELRTPLNAISGWSSLLRSNRLPADRRDHAVEVIARNARTLEDLIADLLDMSRILAGRLRLDVAPFDLASVVADALDGLRTAAASKSLRIETELDPLGGYLDGDARRIEQVVWNLASNAVKFSRPGGEVRVSLRPEEGAAVLRVLDHGEGMTPEFLRGAFEPFHQADAGFARKSGGLGLGLAISRRLVQLHGGTIEARSDGPGTGAEITVRLPLGAAGPGDASGTRAILRPTGRAEVLRGTLVLVVEDEPDSRELVVEILERHGARVTGVASADDAVAAFLRVPPAIVLSDVGLPGEDGLSLVRRLRALPGGARVPTVAVSAFVRAEDRARALEAGFDAHVGKPIEPDDLVDVVVDLLDAAARAPR
ncbi:MAG TPA: ATP-binding protein [Polyangiaceae bacterium]|jgi:signal transduction histidine kinase/CheY-like chemotaxis protein